MPGSVGLTTEELHEMLLFRISRTFRAVTDLTRVRLQELDVTDTQFRVLNAICALENPSVADVVDYSGLSQPVVSQGLKQLEAKGLATRDVDANDGRTRRPTPTPDGVRVFKLGSEELRAVEANLESWLGNNAPSLRTSLDGLLERINEASP